jgi:hypothetical protein
MDGHFKTRKHRVAVLAGTRNIIRLVSDGRAFDMSAGFSERLTARLARKLGGYDLFMRRRVESGWTRAAATRTTSRNEDQSM